MISKCRLLFNVIESIITVDLGTEQLLTSLKLNRSMLVKNWPMKTCAGLVFSAYMHKRPIHKCNRVLCWLIFVIA